MKKKKLYSMPSRLAKPGPSSLNAGGSWRSDKGSANARGYNYQWQLYRAQFLLEHPICAIRGVGCTLAATIVDHVKPHRGDAVLFWNPDNHQSACEHCHDVHKQREEARALR